MNGATGQSDKTLYVGDIVTMDDENTIAEALVVSGDRIEFVGDLAAARDAAGPEARVVELGDKALLPGFVDGHGHLGLETLFHRHVSLDPPPVGTVESMADLKAALAAGLEQGSLVDRWLLGRNYDDAMLSEARQPTRADLDEVSAEVPIAIGHASGHLGVLNSAALQALGFDENSVDPDGGVIRRREGSREPDGVLEEKAWIENALPRLPRPTPAELIQDLAAAQELYLSYGWTTIQEGATIPALMELLQAGNKAGLLKADVVMFPKEPEAPEQVKDLHPDDGYNGRLRVGGVKVILDGSPQGRTAWLSEPYFRAPNGEPDSYRGYPAYPDEEVDTMVAAAHKQGWQVLAHCNGDAAIQQFIDAARHARADAGRDGTDRDFVIIHSQTAREDQLDAMRDVGLMPSFFVTHVYFWGDWHRDVVLGPERGSRISPTRSALDRGIRFTTHNDTPILPPWPMTLVWAAVVRKTRSGQVLGDDQRISVEQALRAITIDAAYQYGEEAHKGSLEPGKRADLVILSANPYDVDPQELRDLVVRETISRGETVYSG